MLPLVIIGLALGLWALGSGKAPNDVDVAAIQRWIDKCKPAGDARIVVIRGSGQPGTTGFDWTTIKAQGWGWDAVLIVNPGLWMLAAQGGDQNTTWIEWRESRARYLAGKC